MEGLLIVVVLYFFFKAIAKRGKGSWQSFKQALEESDAEQPSAPRTPMQNEHAHREHIKQHRPAERKTDTVSSRLMPKNRGEGSSTEGEEKYQPIRPTLVPNNILRNYTGSLGAATGEGRLSGEGMETGGPLAASSRATVDKPAQAVQAVTVPTVRVLPDGWSGDTAVQAVVLNEIFNRRGVWR